MSGTGGYQKNLQKESPLTGSAESKKVLIAMSGGPSSAVAAALLKSQGHQLQGVFFHVCDPKEPVETRFESRCCLGKSLESAQRICRKLDMPLHVVHLEGRYQDKVVDYFIHGKLQGKLPIACIPCNMDIRFYGLFEKAKELGFDYVATGHHVQVFHGVSIGGKPALARLLRAVNADRDQSYFLFGLTQDQLCRLMTPSGGFSQTMLLRLAKEFDLPPLEAPQQQRICSIEVDSYKVLIENRTAASLRAHGNIRKRNGDVVGGHSGLYQYRVGQEPKLHQSIKEKYKIMALDVVQHFAVVGLEPDLLQTEVRAGKVSWVRPHDGVKMLHCEARITPSQQEATPCRVFSFENRNIRVEFEIPVATLQAGQAIAFYEADEVLGGAIVENVGIQPRDE
ncbi:aminomethyltransferase beta-barrel domain-containing protein [Bdellovibrionota bacterium FG-1]